MSKASSTDDKRLRREIANSNERRRMQSINAGFIALRQMLPLNEGEKLSKAAILQLTAKYINVLLQEKSRLLQQNNKLKELLQQQQPSGPCSFSGRANATVTLGDESMSHAHSAGDRDRDSTLQSGGTKDLPVSTRVSGNAPVRSVATTAGVGVGAVAEHETPVTNVVAHEVTVGSDLASLSVKQQQPPISADEAAQMNLPLRKRKRTFSLSVESSVVPLGAKTTHVDSLLSVGGCSRQADATATAVGTATDSGGDTDADGYCAAVSSTSASAGAYRMASNLTRPRDVPPSSSASDADSVAMTTVDRYRFVPSAPLLDASKSEQPIDATAQPLAVLGSTAPYGSVLLSANPASLQPLRFDVITSMQPAGLLLSAPAGRQRYDSLSFESAPASCGASYRSVVSPPAPVSAACESSSTSITKKNLETIFEAIRHLEGDDLSLGEAPMSRAPTAAADSKPPMQQTAAATAAVNAGPTMLVPVATTSESAQAQTTFLVCLSPANLALSPPSAAHASASGDYVQNAPLSFNMNAAMNMNTVMSPVSVNVSGSASRYVPSRTQQLIVNVPGATIADFDYSTSATSGASVRGVSNAAQAAVTCGPLQPTNRHV